MSRLSRALVAAFLLSAPVQAETIADRVSAHLQRAKGMSEDVWRFCQVYSEHDDLYALCALEVVHALELAETRAQCVSKSGRRHYND